MNAFLEKITQLAHKLSIYEYKMLKAKSVDYEKDFSLQARLLDQVCSRLALDYFSKGGVNIIEDKKIRKQKLYKTLNVKSPYNYLVDYIILFLIEDKFISYKNNYIYFKSSINKLKSYSDLAKEINANYPEFSHALQLISHCMSSYSHLFPKELSPTAVLFPNGNTDFIKYYFDKITVKYNNLHLYILLLEKLIFNLYEKPFDLKILEIGAGQGILSWKILEKLYPKIDPNGFQYHFTDISGSFIRKAQKTASQKNISEFMKFSILDFNKTSQDQDFKMESFDLIIAFDSIHAAFNLSESLNYLKNLLKPNGIIVIIESIQVPRWLHLIWGVTPEWCTPSLATKGKGPLMDIKQWNQKLKKNNFSEIFIFPSEKSSKMNRDSTMIICKK